jgi:hypothetical protein
VLKAVVVATVAAAVVTLVGTASPAVASCGATGDVCTAVPATGVTFTVSAGTLTISAQATSTPQTAVLGSNGATATIPLGTTTVSDARLAPASWTMTATASTFTSGVNNIAKTNASFSVQAGWSAPSGMSLPTFATSPFTTPAAVDSNGSRILMSTTAGATNNGVTFTPVLTVAVPSSAVAGTYTGTVTQSVS